VNDQSVPMDLVLRLLSSEDPVSRSVERPGIFVGRLPEEMPVEIPIPEGLSVVGSLVRSEHDPHDDPATEIVLDAAMPAERVRDLFRERMSESGWSERERRGYGGGFGFAPVGTTALFCRGERGPSLFLSAHDSAADEGDVPTDVRLRLITTSRYSPCAPEPYEPEFDRIIPNLAPPPGSYQWPGGGGGGGDDAYSTATLQSDLDATAICAHYSEQLEGAGWSRTDGGRGGSQAWSTWSFADEGAQRWTGVFFALWLAEAPQRYFLLVHAVLAPG
jgi:hypothetical protein